jgi:sodium/bile acid cotransporter 7
LNLSTRVQGDVIPVWSRLSYAVSRQWFLIALFFGVALASLRPSWVRPVVDPIPTRAVVGVALFLMAWDLESRHLWAAVRRPWPAVWAVSISYGVLPALGWLAAPLLSSPDYRIGLLVIVSVPCTLSSAVLWTRMGGGNQATALLVILATTGTSWLITTAWLTWATGLAVGVHGTALMRELFLVLVVPVGLGQLARLFRPLVRLVVLGRKPLGIVSRLLVFAIILKAAADVGSRLDGRVEFASVGWLVWTALLCLGLHLLALGGGLWTGKLLNFERPNQIAVAFACSQKTLPVALLLFDTHFKDTYPLAVVPMVFFHVGQLVVDTFIAEKLAGQAG